MSTNRIAELESLIAVAKQQRKTARQLRVQLLVASINADLRTWGHELASLKAVAA